MTGLRPVAGNTDAPRVAETITKAAAPFLLESDTEAFSNCRHFAQPIDCMFQFPRGAKSEWLFVNRLLTG